MKIAAGLIALVVLMMGLWIFEDPINGWLEAHKIFVLGWGGFAVALYLGERIDGLRRRIEALEWNLGRRESETASLRSEIEWLAARLDEVVENS